MKVSKRRYRKQVRRLIIKQYVKMPIFPKITQGPQTDVQKQNITPALRSPRSVEKPGIIVTGCSLWLLCEITYMQQDVH